MKLAASVLALVFLASCRCPRCWEKSQGWFPTVGTSTIASEMETAHRDHCGDLPSDPGAFDASLWASQCKDAFANYVMNLHCAPQAERYCDEQCTDDPEQCRTTGRQTLERVCAAESFADFVRLMPYCKDFELQNTVPVPKPGGAPHCE